MYMGWIKHFVDGTSIAGPLLLTQHHRVSWQYTRLSDMIGVDYHWKEKKIISVSGTGSYWESEDFYVGIGDPTPVLYLIRLQKYINKGSDNFLSIAQDQQGYHFDFLTEGYHSPHILPINNAQYHNKWYTIEYHIETNKVEHYITANRM